MFVYECFDVGRACPFRGNDLYAAMWVYLDFKITGPATDPHAPAFVIGHDN